MLYKQRETFYDKYSKTTSRDIDHLLYTYFTSISSNVDAICVDGGYFAPQAFEYGETSTIKETRAERQRFALFSKNVSYGSESEKAESAWTAFCEAELNCKRINDTYRANASSFGAGFEEELFLVRRKIADVLGDVPSLSSLQLGFGPGANTTVKKNTSILRKLDENPTCSKSFTSLLSDLWTTIPLYAFLHNGRSRISHGELTFVPKDSTKHRSIIIEPLLNTFVQKGVGKFLKKRIRTFGIDLTDQSINRNRARVASKTGSHATVDLSSASDNISYAVVLDLLPYPWVDFLDKLRTSYILCKERKVSFSLEKYSTMGNGFTFELQSLLFFSLAHAACVTQGIKPDISVFGDDIILPVEAYEHFCSLLDFLGFVVNKKKSFHTGPFRESCGGDYLFGVNIRPFYVLDRWTDARLVAFLNFYEGDPLVSDDLRQTLMGFIKPRNRLFGPKGFGDGHIHDPDFKGDPFKREDGFCGFTFRAFVMRPSKFNPKQFVKGQSLFPLYGLPYSEEELDLFEFRRPFTMTRAFDFVRNENSHDVGGFSERIQKDPCVKRGPGITKVIRIYYIPD
jgi:hypothetical protein